MIGSREGETAASSVGAPLIRITLGDTGLVTESAPTPVFRRFPWVQLVFCIACLTMAAWTWMRFSYAWKVAPEDIDLLVRYYAPDEHIVVRAEDSWPMGRYVTLHAYVVPLSPYREGLVLPPRDREAYVVWVLDDTTGSLIQYLCLPSDKGRLEPKASLRQFKAITVHLLSTMPVS